MIDIEKKVYRTEKDFVNSMLSLFAWKENDEVIGWIKHEKDHFEALKERGYSPKYGNLGVYINILFGEVGLITPYVKTDEKIKEKDLKEVCLAPENPGFFDRVCSNKVFGYFIYSILRTCVEK